MKKVLFVLFIIFGLVSSFLIIIDAQNDSSHSFIKKKIKRMADERTLAFLQDKFLRLSDERKEMVMDMLSLPTEDKDFFTKLSEQEIVMEVIEEKIKKNFSSSNPQTTEEAIINLSEIIFYFTRVNEDIKSFRKDLRPSDEGAKAKIIQDRQAI
ncbi:hypothetical protein HY798_03295 [Candidatus Falkowbacteria bacterium]|nr:hypothetical protein [Candidatus Falkowbacteria bacterium]